MKTGHNFGLVETRVPFEVGSESEADSEGMVWARHGPYE